jgi:hypothetical protein
METRWKYEFPRLINLDENPATGARNATCISGFTDNCNAGSCIAASTCSTGTYANRCQPGNGACSLTKNSACCLGSSVTSDKQHACNCACVTGAEDWGDALYCTNGETACISCSWGYGTVNSATGCWPGNGN